MMHSRSGRLARWCRRIWRGFQPVEFGNISWHQPAPFTFRKSLVTMQYSVLTRRWISAAIIAIVSAQLVACADRPSASVSIRSRSPGIQPSAYRPYLRRTGRGTATDTCPAVTQIRPSKRSRSRSCPRTARRRSNGLSVNPTRRRTWLFPKTLSTKNSFWRWRTRPTRMGRLASRCSTGITIRSRRDCTGSLRSQPIPKTDGKPVLFSWPSQGSLAGYLADRDAALASRDTLVWLVKSMAAKRE